MKLLIIVVVLIALVSGPAQAQWGKLLKDVGSNSLLTQQGAIQDIVGKIQNISTAFSQMPLNSGKVEFMKAALPLLTQAQSLSSDILALAQQGKPVEAAQTTKMTGLLDQVKELVNQKWSASALTGEQTSGAKRQVQQIGDMLMGILKDQGEALKSTTKTLMTH